MIKKMICALLALLMIFGCIGCGKQTVPAPTEIATQPFDTPIVPAAKPAEIPTEAATEAPDETSEAPTETEAETEAPTEATTEAPTEATTAPTPPPAATGPVTLHSGLREDGSFSEGTLFIGDSLTVGFLSGYVEKNGYLGDAKYMAICGAPLTAFFDGTVLEKKEDVVTMYSEEFEGMEFDEAAAAFGEDATAIYFMLGTNYTKNATADSYIEIINYLLTYCPNATIHLQLVPHGDMGKVQYYTVNKRIRAAFEYYEKKGEERVLLVDTYLGIGRANGVDGIHLADIGNRNWYNTLVKHAEENDLPT